MTLWQIINVLLFRLREAFQLNRILCWRIPQYHTIYLTLLVFKDPKHLYINKILHLKQQTQIYKYDKRYFTLGLEYNTVAKSIDSVYTKIMNKAYNSNNNSCNNKQLRKLNAQLYMTYSRNKCNPVYYEDF